MCIIRLLTNDDIIEHLSSEPVNPISDDVESDDEISYEEFIQQPTNNDECSYTLAF